jgi:hypothetical protein
MGMLTMLTALLANESGAVKELGALCLANLVCAPPPPEARGAAGENLEGFGFTARDSALLARRAGIRGELAACKAHAALAALLSSPQARVSIHGAAASFHADRLHSMRCQSLANKHASRAIVNVLLPDLELCTADRERGKDFEGPGAGGGRAGAGGGGGPGGPLPAIASPFAQPPNTVAVVRRGGVEYVPADPLAPLPSDPHLLAFLGSGYSQFARRETAWSCFYFYASGTQKDEHRMRLRLGVDGGMGGSGEDDLGEFLLEGQGDCAFGDNAFAFSKTYTNRGSNVPRGGHVCHIGHYSNGEALGPRSMGFWGVWEIVTANPHFRLEKGGVFRMVPTHVLGEAQVNTYDFRG